MPTLHQTRGRRVRVNERWFDFFSSLAARKIYDGWTLPIGRTSTGIADYQQRPIIGQALGAVGGEVS